MTIGALLAERAGTHGSAMFLETETESLTFDDAHRGANRHARAFADLGVRRGDRVALMLDNSADYVLIVFGLAALGAVGVPLNTAAQGAQLARLVGDCAPVLAVVEDQFAGRAWGGGLRMVTPAAVAAGAAAQPGSPAATETGAADLFLLMYTSGTTGPAKGVMCPHSHPIAVARYASEAFAIEEGERIYCCLPLFHATALWWDVLAALWSAATIVLRRRFSASRFWSDVGASRATRFSAMMSMASILAAREPEPAERAHCVRTTWIAPLPSPLGDWENRFGVRACTDYAMTEMHPLTVLGPADPRPARGGCAGRVNPRDEVLIVDAAGGPLPDGAVGEIVVRPREPGSCFAGYWGHAPPADPWFRTGDLGFLDDGLLYIAGRVKDAIRRRGENVSAWEVEEALKAHPAVADAAAFGLPSPLGEEEVACFVVTRESTSEEDLFRFAAANMAYFMVPRFLRIVSELPINQSFKINKVRIVNEAIEHPERLWDAARAGLAAGRDGVTTARGVI